MDDAETLERDPKQIDDAPDDVRGHTIEGLRHIDDLIGFFNDALAYVKEQGHGNAEAVVTRIVRDLQVLKTIPLPVDEDAEPESDEPLDVAHRRIAALERQVGQLVAASPHANINTTGSLRTAAPNDQAGLPPPLPHERQRGESQEDFEARVAPASGSDQPPLPSPTDPRISLPVDTDGAESINDRADNRPGTL